MKMSYMILLTLATISSRLCKVEICISFKALSFALCAIVIQYTKHHSGATIYILNTSALAMAML